MEKAHLLRAAVIPRPLRKEAESCLAGWGQRLPEPAWARLDSYLADVLEYTLKVNLTADRDFGVLLRRHALDALAALAPLRRSLGPEGGRLLDVGSGGGFIGITLKIAWPEAEVTLAESIYKKYCFLERMSARLGLPGLRAVHGRAGGEPPFPAGLEAPFDAVLARAVAPLAELPGLLLPHARPGGLALLYRSSAGDSADAPFSRELARRGGALEATLPYRLPGETRERNLLIVRKSP